MILGALVGAGLEPSALIEQLQLLGVAGWKIDFEKVHRSGISATYARVQTAHEHAHRHLSDILKIIYDSRLDPSVKDRAALIFSRLAEAESRVHNEPIEKIHFHEVGALDAIVDVCGAAIGFDLLGIDQFISSPLRVGCGMTEMAHGRFPIPPPAVAELLKGKPIYAGDLEGEFVTPTGAAIITSVCDRFEAIPPMRIEASESASEVVVTDVTAEAGGHYGCSHFQVIPAWWKNTARFPGVSDSSASRHCSVAIVAASATVI